MSKTNPKKLIIVTAILVVLAIMIASVLAIVWTKYPEKLSEISNFEQCKEAGGAILESYPEQCLYKSKTYTNDKQSVEGDDYVGLSEEDALGKARRNNIPARVVERAGESLPVTMDFVFGRHNLSIKDGKVYKVEIEGQASDSPMYNGN